MLRFLVTLAVFLSPTRALWAQATGEGTASVLTPGYYRGKDSSPIKFLRIFVTATATRSAYVLAAPLPGADGTPDRVSPNFRPVASMGASLSTATTFSGLVRSQRPSFQPPLPLHLRFPPGTNGSGSQPDSALFFDVIAGEFVITHTDYGRGDAMSVIGRMQAVSKVEFEKDLRELVAQSGGLSLAVTFAGTPATAEVRQGRANTICLALFEGSCASAGFSLRPANESFFHLH